MGLSSCFCRLKSWPSFAPRNFFTSDARLNAFQRTALVQTGIAGLTGITPDHNYFYAIPPDGFAFAVTPAQNPNPAPAGKPNPLITPALAMSFLQNSIGH